MSLKPAKIVEVSPKKVWLRKYPTGSISVIVQHEGCEEFKYCTFDYDYRYTSNSSVIEQAEKIARELGAGEEIKVESFDMIDGIINYMEKTSKEDMECDEAIQTLKKELAEFSQLKLAMVMGLPIWPTKWSQDTAMLAFQIDGLGYKPMRDNEMISLSIKEGYAPWLTLEHYEGKGVDNG